MQPKRIAELAWQAADDKQAVSPVILDISKLTTIAHYFVIAHGNSDRHVRAIAENMRDELEKRKVTTWHAEGFSDGRWIVLDYGGVIAHVFYRDLREFYGLERLWGTAPRVDTKRLATAPRRI